MQKFSVGDGGNPDGTAKDRVGLTAGTTLKAKYWNDNVFNLLEAVTNAGYTLIDEDISQLHKAMKGKYVSTYTYNTASIATQSVDDVVLGSDGYYYKVTANGVTGDNPVGSITENWEKVKYDNGSDTAFQINSAKAKTTPVDADLIGIADSADSFALKKVTWANVKATILSAFGAMINTATAKATPVDADIFIIGDSAASNASKKVTWANIKTVLTTLFAPLASPAFTGNPTAPTQAANNNSTRLATTAYADNLIGSAKAYANFNSIPLSGTYSQTGTVITVTMTSHGMTTGMIVNLDFTSGTATDGTDFVVTNTGANTFTVVGKTSVTTSGNVTRNNYIRKALNVSSITDNGVGDHTVNFLTNMADTNYTALATAGNTTVSFNRTCVSSVYATNSVKITGSVGGTGSGGDFDVMNVTIF